MIAKARRCKADRVAKAEGFAATAGKTDGFWKAQCLSLQDSGYGVLRTVSGAGTISSRRPPKRRDRDAAFSGANGALEPVADARAT